MTLPSRRGPRNVGVFDLMRYRFPITAIASIMHRISGVLLFLFIPILLSGLERSLASEQDFHAILSYFQSPFMRFLLWLGLSGFVYHLIAGIKHLMMDLGHFETIKGSKIASSVVLVLGVGVALCLGVWLW